MAVALRESLSEEDIEYVGHPMLVNKNGTKHQQVVEHNFGTRHKIVYTVHVPCSAIEDQFPGYVRFAFVRNPFARFMSSCIYQAEKSSLIGVGGNWTPGWLMQQMINRIDEVNERVDMFLPQTHWTSNKNGFLVQFIGKTETIQQDYDDLARKFDLVPYTVQRLNKGRRMIADGYKEHYTPKLIEKVGDLYHDDIINFDYTFGD
jgi:hypothetical protein